MPTQKNGGDDGNLPEELAMMQRHMQQQLDALLLGQGRLESAVTKVLCMSSTSAGQDALASPRPHSGFCEEAPHAMPAPESATSRATPELRPKDVEDDLVDADAVQGETADTADGPGRYPSEGPEKGQSTLSDDEVIRERKKEFSVGQLITKAVQQAKAAQTRRRDRLVHILERNHQMEEDEEERRAKQLEQKQKSVTQRVSGLSAKDFETYLDTAMAALIIMNTIFIGLSLDHKEGPWNGWVVADFLFSLIFFAEFVVKIVMNRGFGHFIGPDKFSNLFDACIILVDSVQVSFVLISLTGEAEGASTGNVSLMRVLRLMRILRVLRLLRFKQTKTLEDMMSGLLGGMGTLGWAVVLLALMVYITAIVCRVCLGDPGDANIAQVYPQFESVPRSMFTVFRCAFGDCSNHEGTPLAELIIAEYDLGVLYVFGFTGFVFFVTIGFFNIVSAIFVDSTMAASAEEFFKQKKTRLEDYNLWARNCAIILKELLRAHADDPDKLLGRHDTGHSLHNLDNIMDVEFTRDMVDTAVKSEKIMEALDLLDIDRNDHARLSDILDPDHSGSIGVLELVDGLRRLRGEPRRSDVVALDLMMRSLQDKCESVLEEVLMSVKGQEETHAVIMEMHTELKGYQSI